MSGVGGKPDVPRTWPGRPGIAKRRHYSLLATNRFHPSDPLMFLLRETTHGASPRRAPFVLSSQVRKAVIREMSDMRVFARAPRIYKPFIPSILILIIYSLFFELEPVNRRINAQYGCALMSSGRAGFDYCNGDRGGTFRKGADFI